MRRAGSSRRAVEAGAQTATAAAAPRQPSRKRKRPAEAAAAQPHAAEAAAAADDDDDDAAADTAAVAAADVDDTPGLAQLQAELLRSRALLLRELGLEAGLEQQRAVARSARGSARRSRGARGAPAQPQRASLRVRGVSAQGGAALGEGAGGAAAEGASAGAGARRGSGSSGGGGGGAAAAAASAEGAAGGVEELRGGALGALVQARVQRDCAIKAFVEGALGIVPYVAGRGYHELVEGLPISIYTTEHILQSPSGEFYRGGSAEARAACGGAASRVVAGGGSGRAGGAAAGLPEGWALYLRSRSYARKLRAGQRFLYER